MSVQNVNFVPAQESRQTNHTQRKLSATGAIATETLDSLCFHVVAQPWRNWIERGEEHFIAAAIVPFSKLGEKAAGIAILGEV